MLQRFSLLMARALTFSLEDLRREDGQTTLEYTVVVVLVVAMAAAAFVLFGTAVTNAITKLSTYIQNQVP
jgi:Flp pilus assembly pilin Flp